MVAVRVLGCGEVGLVAVRALGRGDARLVAVGALGLGAVLVATVAAGCAYDPDLGDCAIRCEQGECPGGQSCRADGFCHAGGADEPFAGCGSDGATADASIPEDAVDAPGADAELPCTPNAACDDGDACTGFDRCDGTGYVCAGTRGELVSAYVSSDGQHYFFATDTMTTPADYAPEGSAFRLAPTDASGPSTLYQLYSSTLGDYMLSVEQSVTLYELVNSLAPVFADERPGSIPLYGYSSISLSSVPVRHYATITYGDAPDGFDIYDGILLQVCPLGEP